MSEKVFTKKMTLSICLILLCLCALSISAGAFFSDTAKSNTKTFSTATYDLTITATYNKVTDDTTTPPTTETVTVTPDPSDDQMFELEVNTEGYDAKVMINEEKTSATVSGYCKIVIYDADATNVPIIGEVYTKQIGKAENTAHTIKTFRNLKIVANRKIIVRFIPLWGTYSGTALEDGATVTVPTSGNQLEITNP